MDAVKLNTSPPPVAEQVVSKPRQRALPRPRKTVETKHGEVVYHASHPVDLRRLVFSGLGTVFQVR